MFEPVEINLYHVYFQFLISLSVSLEVIVSIGHQQFLSKLLPGQDSNLQFFAQKMYVSRKFETV